MGVENLSKRRALRDGDCQLWTALDALEDLVQQIKDGEVAPEQIVIHYLEAKEGSGYRYGYQCAGVTYPEHIALLEIAKDRALKGWFDD